MQTIAQSGSTRAKSEAEVNPTLNRTRPVIGPSNTEHYPLNATLPELDHSRKTYLDDGRVVKGAEFINGIPSRYEEHVAVQCCTWQCGRIMRREFNLVMSKMYFLSRDDQKNKRIQMLVNDIHFAAIDIANMGVDAKGCNEPMAPQPVRLITPEARQLLDAIMLVDAQLNKMLNSPYAEVAEENCDQFFATYSRFKRYVLVVNQNKQAY